MELPQEEEIERVLEWYEKDPGDALVGEELLKDVSLEELRAIFMPDEDADPRMYLPYEVQPADVSRLQRAVAHQINLDAFDYFVSAYGIGDEDEEA